MDLGTKVEHLSEYRPWDVQKMCADFVCPPDTFPMIDLDKFECRRGKCTEEECCMKIVDVVTASESESESESCECFSGVANKLSCCTAYCEDLRRRNMYITILV